MRRERSQSSDRGRPHGSKGGTIRVVQLPRDWPLRVELTVVCMVFLTVLQEDSSVPERSRVRTSESGVSAGGSRPSLFDGLSSGFSPFGAVQKPRSFRGELLEPHLGGFPQEPNAQTLNCIGQCGYC